MLITASPSCHSAAVDLELHVNGQVFSLRQTSADFIDVQQPVEMPPCEGEVVVWIDGREHRSRVFLVEGMNPSCEQVKLKLLR